MRKPKLKIDFVNLWAKAVELTNQLGDISTHSVLLNNSRRKEQILRRLGIIGDMDLERISTKVKLQARKRPTKPRPLRKSLGH